MATVTSKSDIYSKVQEALVDALGVDDDEVTPEATLQGDLGAESIDFLDIVFRLEKQFGVKIPREELFPESIFQGDPEFVKDGKVTAKGLAELRSKMPYADLSEFEKNPTLEGISDLFTVHLIVSYIESKLAAGASRAAA
jgi:acyl carrier protein